MIDSYFSTPQGPQMPIGAQNANDPYGEQLKGPPKKHEKSPKSVKSKSLTTEKSRIKKDRSSSLCVVAVVVLSMLSTSMVVTFAVALHVFGVFDFIPVLVSPKCD